MAARTIRLVLGDQLDPQHSWFRSRNPDVLYVLLEVRQELEVVVHHIQKIVSTFAAMRRFAEGLRREGHRVIYLCIQESEPTFEANLARLIREQGCTRLEYQRPDDFRLDEQFKGLELGIEVRAVDTEHFLTSRGEIAALLAGKKRLIMDSFYRAMRRRLGVLMEGDRPAGARWSFDAENRGRWDQRTPLPPPTGIANEARAIHREILASGVRWFGRIDPGNIGWPLDRRQALAVLERFVAHALPAFGRYQDAMSRDSETLFHSLLSFPLNFKMLRPREVVDRALAEWQARPGEIGLAQVEAFVRQIIGWREYMRGIYWARMPGYARENALANGRPLPGWYWSGRTGMSCLAAVIGQSLESAYAHHIQRLMITGNFALLAGIHPDQVDAWYLGIYIDALPWVEMPNTRGMSQYADGGLVATKPYVSSAAYIRRMSDYCDGCTYDPRLRYGSRACPFNSLYWRFFEAHRDRLAANPRVGMVYRNLARMDGQERRRVFEQADRHLEHLEAL